MRSFSHAQCGHVFLPVHLASKTGGIRLTTFSIAKSRKPIKNCSTGPSLLFFGRKTKVALVGIPALLGMPIFSWSRYAPVFEVEPYNGSTLTHSDAQLEKKYLKRAAKSVRVFLIYEIPFWCLNSYSMLLSNLIIDWQPSSPRYSSCCARRSRLAARYRIPSIPEYPARRNQVNILRAWRICRWSVFP